MVVNFRIRKISRGTRKLVQIPKIMHAWYYKVCLHGVLKPLSNNYNLEDKIFSELILFFFFFFFFIQGSMGKKKTREGHVTRQRALTSQHQSKGIKPFFI